MGCRLAIVVLLSLAMRDTASAATPDAAGLGLVSCAVFAKEYGNSPDYAETMWFSWLQGYMSGMNAVLKFNGQARRNLGGVTPEEKKQFVRRFCNAHPLDYYITGAKLLFLSLPVVSEDRAKPTMTLAPKAP
jgi:hypothetical protein